MRRIILLMSLLMLLPAWAAAQYGEDVVSRLDGSWQLTCCNSAGQDLNRKTVEGCLKQADSNFSLTDRRTGESFLLTGEMTADLNADVGHIVRLRGKITTSDMEQPGSMASQQANEVPTLEVISIRHVSSPTCGEMH